eukprot:6487691-Amphidinium_carterae.1
MAKRRTAIAVLYNPQRAGDCLFAAASRACLQKHGSTLPVSALRRLVRDRLWQANPDVVAATAERCGQTSWHFIESVTKGRWGTTLDLEILAEVLELPCLLLNKHTGKILYDSDATGSTKQKSLIVYKDFHFTLCKATNHFGRNRRSSMTKGNRSLNKCGTPNDKRSFALGGAPKRPYPFANRIIVDDDDASSSTSTVADETQQEYDLSQAFAEAQRLHPGQRKEIVLIYHGSFGPFHVGHREGLRAALAHIAAYGGKVRRAIVGFTTQRQFEKKVPTSAFACVEDRVNIALTVIAEGQKAVFPVAVDRESYATSSAMAQAHQHHDVDLMYLVGTDVMKRPAYQTLVVTRTEEERNNRNPYMDWARFRGVAVQTLSLNVTSTIVRERLEQR